MVDTIQDSRAILQEALRSSSSDSRVQGGPTNDGSDWSAMDAASLTTSLRLLTAELSYRTDPNAPPFDLSEGFDEETAKNIVQLLNNGVNANYVDESFADALILLQEQGVLAEHLGTSDQHAMWNAQLTEDHQTGHYALATGEGDQTEYASLRDGILDPRYSAKTLASQQVLRDAMHSEVATGEDWTLEEAANLTATLRILTAELDYRLNDDTNAPRVRFDLGLTDEVSTLFERGVEEGYIDQSFVNAITQLSNQNVLWDHLGSNVDHALWDAPLTEEFETDSYVIDLNTGGEAMYVRLPDGILKTPGQDDASLTTEQPTATQTAELVEPETLTLGSVELATFLSSVTNIEAETPSIANYIKADPRYPAYVEQGVNELGLEGESASFYTDMANSLHDIAVSSLNKMAEIDPSQYVASQDFYAALETGDTSILTDELPAAETTTLEASPLTGVDVTPPPAGGLTQPAIPTESLSANYTQMSAPLAQTAPTALVNSAPDAQPAAMESPQPPPVPVITDLEEPAVESAARAPEDTVEQSIEPTRITITTGNTASREIFNTRLADVTNTDWRAWHGGNEARYVQASLESINGADIPLANGTIQPATDVLEIPSELRAYNVGKNGIDGYFTRIDNQASDSVIAIDNFILDNPMSEAIEMTPDSLMTHIESTLLEQRSLAFVNQLREEYGLPALETEAPNNELLIGGDFDNAATSQTAALHDQMPNTEVHAKSDIDDGLNSTDPRRTNQPAMNLQG